MGPQGTLHLGDATTFLIVLQNIPRIFMHQRDALNVDTFVTSRHCSRGHHTDDDRPSAKPHLQTSLCHTAPVHVTMDSNRTSKTMYIITDECEKDTQRCPTTPCYWLESINPDMVSPILKELATQHMKYVRTSPNRASGRRGGQTQIQAMEDLYWAKLGKMGVDDFGLRNRSSTSFRQDAIGMRNAHMYLMATLNRNNNGNTKERKQCQERAKPRSRHGYSSKRPTNAMKLCCAKETHHGDLDRNQNKPGSNTIWSHGLSNNFQTAPKQDGNVSSRDHVVGWKNHKEPTQGERIVVKKANVGGAEGVSTSFSGRADTSVKTDHGKNDGPSLERLLWEVSHFKSISEIPLALQDKLLQKLCKPLLNGGYKDDKTLWSNLFSIPLPDLCKLSSSGFVPNAATDTIPQPETHKQLVTYMKQCNELSERSSYRQVPKPCRSDTPMNSLWDDDFIHEHYILSPFRASLGQVYHNDHVITSLSTIDHDEDKPASHAPFPSEYVFKKVCGPSFNMSPDFRYITIPTLPSDMVNYQVETDGLNDKIIGTGCSGKVYAATLTLSPRQSREIAVKEMYMNMRSQRNIVNETRIALYLEPTGFVPICYGLVKDEKGGYSIAMELFGSGQTLRAIINTKKTLPKIHWLHIAYQLVDGLCKIHDKDVIINDIKPDNILVDLSGTRPKVKYCDMGSASYKIGVTFDQGQDMKNFIYIAPEVCAYAPTTKASDIYSLGKVFQNIHSCSQIHTMLVLYNMCSTKTPSDRPALSCLRCMLHEEYTKEVLSQTEAARGVLNPREQEIEPQLFVNRDSESPGKKGSPHASPDRLGNKASEVESCNSGENAAPDNQTQSSLPSTVRCATNTESTLANSGASTAHDLSARFQKLPDAAVESSAIQQTCDGTNDDCPLPTITEETVAIIENQDKPIAPAKTDESQLIRRSSSLVKEDLGMYPEAASEGHSMSSQSDTESAEPLLAHQLSTGKMKEAPSSQDRPKPASSSVLKAAVHTNLISHDASVFEKPGELTFSDAFYFLGLLIMLAFRLLWTTDGDVH
ncbi:uncharacterized protein [Haliotis asinina]|uniref:uncharacterized protein n=1 Tax=Haliotis asinina TaxID=109174 RepID=UPI0035321873